ncbi:heat shock factor protein-like [Euwallacea similis]|uniref:heat shock factor protein-like n=1 Tax=Euwallacea similis TaxID=1736056 RepID=UPI00344E3118
MDKRRITKVEAVDQPDNEIQETPLSLEEDSDYLPVINIVVNPDDPQNINELSLNVTLFIKKLWKIVNDEQNKNIISWNENGDGFIIHDQVAFITETLPRYFKHIQLSSFVRQLNLYDFHKTQPLENNTFMFSHQFFLKDVPQLLSLIKRKPVKVRPRAPIVEHTSEQSSIMQELTTAIQDITARNAVISTDMTKLRQENAVLWGEINSLRLKYSKQTKIINKLIHFLIAYMQEHQNSRKSGRTVSRANVNKFLKTGPKIMELDHKYKNNPHEFWTDYDIQQRGSRDHSDHLSYTVTEPVESSENASKNADKSPSIHVSPAVEEVFANASQLPGSSDCASPHFDYATSHPSSSKPSSSALQRSAGSKDNFGYIIDNSRMEINTLKELLKNLTPEDMTNFYKLVNDNYRDQEEDLELDVEKELTSLNELASRPQCTAEVNIQSSSRQAIPTTKSSSVDLSATENDRILAPPLDQQMDKFINIENTAPALPFDDIIQLANNPMEDADLGLINDELLNATSDDVSIDQFLNLN